MRRPALSLALLGCAAAAACGNSNTTGATYASDVGGAGGAVGAGGTGASGSGGASSSASSSAESSASSGASSSATSSASSASSTSSASSASSSSGAVCSYAAPNVCDNALELSEVAGDSGSDVRTVSGQTSKWFKVHITEPSGLISGVSYTVTLSPASDVDFDLFIYDGSTTQPNCFAPVKQATGTPETYSDSWSDTVGSDDGRWLILEVRYVGGTGCGAAAKWTLTVTGNT